MRKILNPIFMCKLLISFFDRVQNDSLKFCIGSLFLQFFDLLLSYLFDSFGPLLKFILIDAFSSPLIPAAGNLWSFNLFPKFIFDLLFFMLLKLFNSFLFILSNEEISQSLILLGKRDNLFSFSLKVLQIFIDIKGHFKFLFIFLIRFL